MDIVQRVKDITLKPKDTWPVIKTEQATIKELYTSYAVILAAIPPIASFIGMSLIRYFHDGDALPDLLWDGDQPCGCLLCFIPGRNLCRSPDYRCPGPQLWFSEKLGQCHQGGRLFLDPLLGCRHPLIIPTLSPMAVLLSLYSLYLFYLGLPIMMDTPKDKAMGYFMVTIVISIVIFILIGTVSRALFGMGRMGM